LEHTTLVHEELRMVALTLLAPLLVMDVWMSSNFFKLLLLQFLSDPHKTWCIWSVCHYAKTGTDFL